MKSLFKSEELQQQFEKEGVVKVSLLKREQVAYLKNEYLKVANQHEQIDLPYITTSHSNNVTLITQVDAAIQLVLVPALEKVLINHKILFGNFLVKMPLENSSTEPHQDITFVDENDFVSANVWVAMEDINANNGGMYFLKGSHKFMPTIRPTHDYKWAYEFVKEEIKANAEIFTAKAGDAIIFNHATIHGSFANLSSKPRLAAVLAAYSAQAELIHYYLPKIESNIMKKYRMSKEAYLTFVKQQPPSKGEYIGEESFDFRQITKHEMMAFVSPRRKLKNLIAQFLFPNSFLQ